MSNTISIQQAAANLPQLVESLGASDEIILTDGDRAVLRLPLTQVPRGPVDLALEAEAFIRPDHPVLRVSVLCEQTVVAEWVITTPDVTTYSASIPERLSADKGALTLSLAIDNPKSPRDSGESTDVRRLGLGVRGLRLDWP